MILKIEELIEDCKKQIKDFADIAVIGLSGGADSTLVAILCTLALGKENVCGIELPCDNYVFIGRVGLIEKQLGINSASCFLKSVLYEFLRRLYIIKNDNTKKLIGNISARLRMIVLYAKCEEFQNFYSDKKVRVIGTDNYSENFLGYFTKGGDGQVDINPIEELYKSEVYQLLDYFKDKGIITEECINRTPSAGLWEGQTDEGELGITYDRIERAIRYINKHQMLDDKDVNKVFKMHLETLHKREIPGKFELRQYYD